MPFTTVQSEKLSGAVVRQVEELILRGILRPGERLPSERELAERLGVSRPSLRDAIGTLQDSGLLIARAGAGVFVADVLGSAFAPALTQLFARHDEAVFDYLSFRRDMEGMAAERAARLGSDTDLKVVQAVFSKMETADPKRTAEDEAQLDAQFHMAIIEASHVQPTYHAQHHAGPAPCNKRRATGPRWCRRQGSGARAYGLHRGQPARPAKGTA
jgi:GntR family transcriptional repressor for pyruvate dehydrogenase complex